MHKIYMICFLALVLNGCTIRHPGLFAFSGYCTSDKHFDHDSFTLTMNKNREEAMTAIANYFPGLQWQTTAGLTLVVTVDLTVNPNFTKPNLYKAQYNVELRNPDKEHTQLELSGLLCSPQHKKRAREIERTMWKLLK